MACKFYINGKTFSESEVKDYIGDNYIDSKDIQLTTLGDLSDLLAYSNSKLILPGYEVEYTTPDNEKFKTYQEASNHISELAKSVEDVDLDKININDKLSEEDLKEIKKLEDLKQKEENYLNSAEYQEEKTLKLKELNEKLNEIQNKKVVFKSQEPSLTREDANKYGFEDYKFVRVESSYSRGYNPHPNFLNIDIGGKAYEGYYIHGYNTEIGKPSTKVIPITKEQAEEIWNKENIRIPNFKYEVDDQQNIYRLQDEIKRTSEDSFIKYKIIELENEIFRFKYEGNPIFGFIKKNKEYEQSKEIIEEWKKVNNIQYNPEEIYSRGQEFSSVVGAYSSFDVNLMMQNLLSHIEDNEKAGGQFAISAFTKPIDKTIGHLESGGGKIKFKIYPKSEDILWATNRDAYSGSVWDASEKINKDKKSELLGVSYTKYPSLSNVNTVQPNLASIVDDLNHHHNELGIVLTGNNFRLEYDEDIPYTTKKIIDGINKILDQKYGKLVKPEIKKGKLETVLVDNPLPETERTGVLSYDSDRNGGYFLDTIVGYERRGYALGDKVGVWKVREILKIAYPNSHVEIQPITGKVLVDGKDIVTHSGLKYETGDKIKKTVRGIQPAQTNETLKESIESVKNNQLQRKTAYSVKEGNILRSEGWKSVGFNHELEEEYFEKPSTKEYTSQALINTKIARLKEVAKKYPRSLIRSEVRRSFGSPDIGFENDELPFQKIPNSLSKEQSDAIDNVFDENPELAGAVYSALGFKTLENNKLEQDILEIIKGRENTPSSIFLSFLLNNNLIPKIQEYITSTHSHRHGEWNDLYKRLTLDYSIRNTSSEKTKLISHELMHSLSHKYIVSYEALNQPDFKKHIEKVNENEKIKGTNRRIELANLTAEQITAFDNLVRIKQKVFDFIKAGKFKKNEKFKNTDFGHLTYAFSELDKREDIHEFISEAFSNPILIDVLKQIPTEGNKSNLFKDFINALKTILGFNNDSIIEDILHYSEEAFIKDAIKNSTQQKTAAQKIYTQYLQSLEKSNTNPVLQDNQSVITSNDRIIFGHPGIGKTFAKKSNDFIDVDEDYKEEHTMQKILRNHAKNTGKEEDLKAWEDYVTDWWTKVKSDAVKSGKQIFVSNLPILRLFPQDFDKVITISEETFVNRAKQRNDYIQGDTEDWKNSLDIEIAKIDKSKVVTTDKYLSDLFDNTKQEQVKKFVELQERLNNKEFLEGAKNAFESSEELQNVYYEAAGFKTTENKNSVYPILNKKEAINTLQNRVKELEKELLLTFEGKGRRNEFWINEDIRTWEKIIKTLEENDNINVTNVFKNQTLGKDLSDKKGVEVFELESNNVLKVGVLFEKTVDVINAGKKVSSPRIHPFTEFHWFKNEFAAVATKAKGVPLKRGEKLRLSELEKQNLYSDLAQIENAGLTIDISKHNNFYYNKGEGIHFIDLGAETITANEKNNNFFLDNFFENTSSEEFRKLKESFKLETQITPQQKQDALNAYTDYLARVSLGIIKNPSSGEFNNSVVKDIVYHGASKDFQGFIKNKKIIPKGKTKGGIWFTDFANADWVYKEEEGKVIAALINLKNPIEYKTERYFDDEYGDYLNSKPLKEGQWKDVQQLIDNKQGDGLLLDIFDATTSGDIGEFTKQQVVFEPEQIHILSSKQDIEGFKDFVTQSSTTIKPEIQKLFNSNPELVNKVYETLGIKTASIEFKIEPFGKSIDNIEIFKDGKKFGDLQIVKNNKNNTLIVSRIEIREKGFGKYIYLKLQEQYPDLELRSDSKALSNDAVNMWDSFVKKGLAIKNAEKDYTLNIQQVIQLYSQYLDTGRGDIEGFKDFVNNKKNEVVKESNNQSLQDGLQWLKQIMPDVEPLLVDGLIDNIANGKYDILNDVITLSEDFANKGVVKEEVFHRWWEKMIPNQTEVENILNEKIENREITKDCKNDFKATQGLTTTTNGTNWSIIEDLKGNSHKLGGIDLTIGEDGISFKNNNSDIKAQDGLLIPSDKNKTNNYDNEFLNNWYKNRQIQDSYIQEAFELDKPEYLKKIEKYPEVKVVDKIDNNPNITGQYNKEKNEIYLTKDAEDSTLTHEQNHYINDFESYMKTIHDNIVKNEIKPIEDITHNGVKKNYDYLSNSNEIHSRIMILREKAGFKPNEFINEEKLDNYLKTYKGDVSNIEDLLYLMKDKKSLLNMLNYMAYNSNNNTENNA